MTSRGTNESGADKQSTSEEACTLLHALKSNFNVILDLIIIFGSSFSFTCLEGNLGSGVGLTWQE